MVKRYPYPGREESYVKPYDGQLYCVYDQFFKVKRVFQWDGFLEEWFDVTSTHIKGTFQGRIDA